MSLGSGSTDTSLYVLHNYMCPCWCIYLCVFAAPETPYPHPVPLLISGWVSPVLVLGRLSVAGLSVGMWPKDRDEGAVSVPVLTGFNPGSFPALNSVGPVLPVSMNSRGARRRGILEPRCFQAQLRTHQGRWAPAAMQRETGWDFLAVMADGIRTVAGL